MKQVAMVRKEAKGNAQNRAMTKKFLHCILNNKHEKTPQQYILIVLIPFSALGYFGGIIYLVGENVSQAVDSCL